MQSCQFQCKAISSRITGPTVVGDALDPLRIDEPGAAAALSAVGFVSLNGRIDCGVHSEMAARGLGAHGDIQDGARYVENDEIQQAEVAHVHLPGLRFLRTTRRSV